MSSKLHGYGGKPRRFFKLAPHQRLLSTGKWSKPGLPHDQGLKVLRDPNTGWAVARLHSDLKPGEVSVVLE